MILIPGLGFGAGVFDEFMAGFAGEYRMYAVTLPGFGGTAAPPSPGATVSFGEQTWTNGAVAAIEKLIDDEKIDHAVVVGHWLTGTQIALRLEMSQLTVPTLVLEPGLEGLQYAPGQNYMEAFCRTSWKGCVENNPNISVRTIPKSRACLWFDQPQKVKQAVVDFLK